ATWQLNGESWRERANRPSTRCACVPRPTRSIPSKQLREPLTPLRSLNSIRCGLTSVVKVNGSSLGVMRRGFRSPIGVLLGVLAVADSHIVQVAFPLCAQLVPEPIPDPKLFDTPQEFND